MNRFPFPPYRSGIPHWTERVVTYCAKVLPIVFDNSLSYYEFLGHMQVKLNEVIKALNSQNLVFVEFTHMIELELQNFEKYMEDRQDNFEQQMQDEWQAFKTEMEEAWQTFKTAMEEAWQQYQDEMNEAWADFQADMLQRFQTFQNTITAQQTAFEQRMEAVQQQFEDDMENRADTFEQTLTAQQNAFEQNIEQELEDWKDIAIRAILDTIRQELPDMIEDVVSEEIIEPVVKQEIARNGFAKILSASNLTAGDTLDLTSQPLSIYDGGVLRGDSLTIADLANVEIKPNTSIVFTSQLLWRNVGNIRALVSDAAFPASGWRLQIGKYTTQQAIGNTFDVGNFTDLVSSPLSDSSTAYYANSNTGVDAGLGYYQYVCIRFTADPAETSFTCDYSAGIEFEEPRTADLVVQSELNGNKYLIPKYVVDEELSPTSTNPIQNKSLQKPIASLINRGSKNRLKLSDPFTTTVNGITFTVQSDQTVLVTGTASDQAIAIISAEPYTARQGDLLVSGLDVPNPDAFLYTRGGSTRTNANIAEEFSSTDIGIARTIAISVTPEAGTVSLTFKPMICTEVDYKSSSEFVPYAPTNRELYEMILALNP